MKNVKVKNKKKMNYDSFWRKDSILDERDAVLELNNWVGLKNSEIKIQNNCSKFFPQKLFSKRKKVFKNQIFQKKHPKRFSIWDNTFNSLIEDKTQEEQIKKMKIKKKGLEYEKEEYLELFKEVKDPSLVQRTSRLPQKLPMGLNIFLNY